MRTSPRYSAPLPQIDRKLHVRNGSKAALTAPKSNFRFTPESGLKSDIAPCPKSATRRHSSRQLLDHLVGEREQVWRDRDTKLPCGLEIEHQPELAGLLDRQIAGLYAPDYFGSVGAGTPKAIHRISGISQEQTG